MIDRPILPWGAALLAGAGLVVPVVTPPAPIEGPHLVAAPALRADQSLIIGGSGASTSPDVVGMTDRYITPNFPNFTTDNAFGLPTPGGLYPLTGVKSLPLDTSVDQGATILHGAIGAHLADGNNLVVLGYSQSAASASLEMARLAGLGAGAPSADQLAFVLLADPMNPNGGILERFAGLTLPSLGLDFYGATDPDTIYSTDVYTLEYDPIADFPRYPLNILADLNALFGAVVHGLYPSLDPELIKPASEGGQAILLPGSADLTGEGATNYWMIPTEDLPLLSLLRAVPVLGNPLADLLQPDLRILVNLGYGSISDGWDQGPANEATPFGLFPTGIDPADVLTALAAGAQQGWQDFVADLGALPGDTTTAATGGVADTATVALPGIADVVNALSGAIAGGYSALLPTADILNAALTSLPAYNVSLFAEALGEGDLLGAIGNPIAADLGLGTMAAGFELLVLAQAAGQVSAALSSIF